MSVADDYKQVLLRTVQLVLHTEVAETQAEAQQEQRGRQRRSRPPGVQVVRFLQTEEVAVDDADFAVSLADAAASTQESTQCQTVQMHNGSTELDRNHRFPRKSANSNECVGKARRSFL